MSVQVQHLKYILNWVLFLSQNYPYYLNYAPRIFKNFQETQRNTKQGISNKHVMCPFSGFY